MANNSGRKAAGHTERSGATRKTSKGGATAAVPNPTKAAQRGALYAEAGPDFHASGPHLRTFGKNKLFCKGRLIGGPDLKMGILTMLLTNIPCVLFHIFISPYWGKRSGPGALVGVFCAICQVVTVFFWTITAFADPGIIPRQRDPQNAFDLYAEEHRKTLVPRHQDMVVSTQTWRVKYCGTCHIYRPPRCHHCPTCDNCVERFDHHCPWVGNCVGRRNYRRFVLFTLSITVLLFYVLTTSCAALILIAKKFIAIEGSTSEGLKAMWGEAWCPALLTLYTFGFVWFPISIGTYHTRLVLSNTTTYEEIKGIFEDEGGNPWDRGRTGNCKEVLCTPSRGRFIDTNDPSIDTVYEPRHIRVMQPLVEPKDKATNKVAPVAAASINKTGSPPSATANQQQSALFARLGSSSRSGSKRFREETAVVGASSPASATGGVVRGTPSRAAVRVSPASDSSNRLIGYATSPSNVAKNYGDDVTTVRGGGGGVSGMAKKSSRPTIERGHSSRVIDGEAPHPRRPEAADDFYFQGAPASDVGSFVPPQEGHGGGSLSSSDFGMDGSVASGSSSRCEGNRGGRDFVGNGRRGGARDGSAFREVTAHRQELELTIATMDSCLSYDGDGVEDSGREVEGDEQSRADQTLRRIHGSFEIREEIVHAADPPPDGMDRKADAGGRGDLSPKPSYRDTAWQSVGGGAMTCRVDDMLAEAEVEHLRRLGSTGTQDGNLVLRHLSAVCVSCGKEDECLCCSFDEEDLRDPESSTPVKSSCETSQPTTTDRHVSVRRGSHGRHASKKFSDSGGVPTAFVDNRREDDAVKSPRVVAVVDEHELAAGGGRGPQWRRGSGDVGGESTTWYSRNVRPWAHWFFGTECGRATCVLPNEDDDSPPRRQISHRGG